MRPNEVFRTRWEDVFFQEDFIFVPKSKTEACRRKMQMSARLKQRLWEQRKSAKSAWVYPGRRGEGYFKSIAVGFQERMSQGWRRSAQGPAHLRNVHTGDIAEPPWHGEYPCGHRCAQRSRPNAGEKVRAESYVLVAVLRL